MFNGKEVKIDKSDYVSYKKFICPCCHKGYTVKTNKHIKLPDTIIVSDEYNWAYTEPEIQVQMYIMSPCCGDLMIPVDFDIAKIAIKLMNKGYDVKRDHGQHPLMFQGRVANKTKGTIILPRIVIGYNAADKIKQTLEAAEPGHYDVRVYSEKAKRDIVAKFEIKNNSIFYSSMELTVEGFKSHLLNNQALRDLLDMCHNKMKEFVTHMPDNNEKKVEYDLD